MPILRELLTLIGYEVDDQGYKKAEQGFKKLTTLAGVVMGAAVGATAAMVALGKSAAGVGNEAATTALRLGITSRQVQELEYASRSLALPAETLVGAMKSISAAVEEARYSGGGAAEGFWRLGIRTSDAAGKARPALAVFRDIADKIASTQEPGLRAALATRLLGETGAELLPLLTQGSAGVDALMASTKQLPGILSEVQVAAGQKLTRQLAQVGIVASGTARELGAALLPVLSDTVTRISVFANENKTLVTDAAKALVTVGESLGKVFVDVLIPAVSTATSVLVALVKTVDQNRIAFETFAGVILTLVATALAIVLVGALTSVVTQLGLLFASLKLLYGAAGLGGLFSLVGELGTVGKIFHTVLLPWVTGYRGVLNFVAALRVMTASQAILWLTGLSKAALLFSVRMLAAVAAPIALAVALTAIGLVIEDVYYWATGGQSAIGNFYKAFVEEGIPPDAHWMVRALRTIIILTHDALKGVDELFKGFFDEAVDDGWANTLKDTFGSVVTYWLDMFLRLVETIGAAVQNMPLPLRIAIGAATLGGSEAAVSAKNSGLRESLGISRFVDTGPSAFANRQFGTSPFTSPPLAGQPAQMTSVKVDSPISLTIQAPPGADPQQIANLTQRELEALMKRRDDEAQRVAWDQLQPRMKY